ncbi:MAG: hypothetical protein NTV49_15735 [Kiritimatiellaeota bacterium]|nr:hypothetical protein [Kiritimatiellota bacterium]
MLNKDYRDILQAFSDAGVDFLLVGAYALAAHGYPRATMDIDLWVKPSATNAAAVLRALRQFGAPLENISLADLLRNDTIFQIGVAPCRIDIITGATGLDYATARTHSIVTVVDGIKLSILSLDDLIINKRAAGRTKDLADAEVLETLKKAGRTD